MASVDLLPQVVEGKGEGAAAEPRDGAAGANPFGSLPPEEEGEDRFNRGVL